MASACPVQTGDTVKVYERYDDAEDDIVVSVRIGPGPFNGIAAQHLDESDEINWEAWRRLPRHEWWITVKNNHRMGKDEDSYTNIVSPRNVMVNGEWLPDEQKLRSVD